jgi:hypothetical protein
MAQSERAELGGNVRDSRRPGPAVLRAQTCGIAIGQANIGGGGDGARIGGRGIGGSGVVIVAYRLTDAPRRTKASALSQALCISAPGRGTPHLR